MSEYYYEEPYAGKLHVRICIGAYVVRHLSTRLAIKLLETYQKSGKNVSLVIKFAIEEYQSFMNDLASIDTEEELMIARDTAEIVK